MRQLYRMKQIFKRFRKSNIFQSNLDSLNFKYEGWNFNSGNYLFTTDTK